MTTQMTPTTPTTQQPSGEYEHCAGDGARSASGAVSGGVAGIGQLPTFDLPDTGGGQVRSWDYRSRRHLVLWLAGATPDRRALAEAAAREPELQAEGAVLLVIVQGTREEPRELRAGTTVCEF